MLEAEFSGWICWHNRYDPAYMGYDEVVEILEEILEVITAARTKEILEKDNSRRAEVPKRLRP